MNVEKLKRLQAQVRIGGKGTPRRKKKVMHQTAATDDKKLQSSLKKLSVSTIPGIEEVNIIKDDLTVIHFNNPKAQASLSANTFAVTGHGETKKIVEMLPEILPQLGQETVVQLRMFANSMSASTNPKQGNATVGGPAANVLGSVVEEDDVPMLVSDFDEVAKLEAANGTKSQAKPKGKGKENQPQETVPADIPKDVSAAKTETINNISNEEKILKDDKKLNLNVTAETGQKPKDKPAGKDNKDAKKAKKQDKQEAGDKANKTNKDNKKASAENKKDNLNKNPPQSLVEGAEEKKTETLDAQLKELLTASKDTKPSNKEPMMDKLPEQPVTAKQAKKQNQEKPAVKKDQSQAKEAAATIQEKVVEMKNQSPAKETAAKLPSTEENKIKTNDGRKDQPIGNEQKSLNLKAAVETTKSEEKPNLQSSPAIEQKIEIAAVVPGKPTELPVKLEEIKKEPEAITPKDSEVITPKLEELKSQAMETPAPKPLANLEIKEPKPSENTSAETKDAKPSEQTTPVILEVKPEQTPVAAYITSLDANHAKQEKVESAAVVSVPVDQPKPLEDKAKISEEKTAIVEIKQSQSAETPTVINLEATKDKASDLVKIENVDKPANIASVAIPLPDKPKEEIKAEKKIELEATDKPLDKDPKKKPMEEIAKEEPKADTKIESMTIESKRSEEPKTEIVVQSKESKRPETKLIIESTQQPPIPMPQTAAPEQKSEQKSGNKTPTTASPQPKASPPKQSANKKTPPPQDAAKQQPKLSTPSAKAANNEPKKPEGAKAKQASPPKAQQQQQQQQAGKNQSNVAKSQQNTTKSSPTKTPEKSLGPTTPTKTPDKTPGPTTPVKTPDKPTTPTKSPEKAVVAPTTPTKSPDKATVAPTTPTKSPEKAVVAPTTPTKSPDKATVAPPTPTKSPEKAVATPTTPTKTPDKPTTPTKSPDKAVMTPTTPTKSPEKPAIAPKPTAPTKSTTPTKQTAPAQGQSKNKAATPTKPVTGETPDSQAQPDANKKSPAETGAKAKHQAGKNRPNTSGNAPAKAVPPPQATKQTTPSKAEEVAAKQQTPPALSQASQPSSN